MFSFQMSSLLAFHSEMAGRPTISYIWWAVILAKNSSSESSSIHFEDEVEVAILGLVLAAIVSDLEMLLGLVLTTGTLQSFSVGVLIGLTKSGRIEGMGCAACMMVFNAGL